jgi:hypothetical protein
MEPGIKKPVVFGAWLFGASGSTRFPLNLTVCRASRIQPPERRFFTLQTALNQRFTDAG